MVNQSSTEGTDDSLFFSYIASSFRQNEKLLILQNSYSAVSENLAVQSENTLQLKKIRHDMKKHLELIHILIEKGNYDSAEKVLEEVIEQTDLISINICQSTGNSIIDAIISHKAAIFKSRNIEFDYYLESLPELSIDPIDISSIISNLLENAMEATLKTVRPYIQLRIFMHNKYLSIYAKNTYSKDVTKDAQSYLSHTSKPDPFEHGYGTIIIQELSVKYNGDFTWKTGNEYFIANVIIKNQI